MLPDAVLAEVGERPSPELTDLRIAEQVELGIEQAGRQNDVAERAVGFDRRYVGSNPRWLPAKHSHHRIVPDRAAQSGATCCAQSFARFVMPTVVNHRPCATAIRPVVQEGPIEAVAGHAQCDHLRSPASAVLTLCASALPR